MSKIRVDHVFTSESVSEGHPDKVCDQISDAILDACLEQDSKSRVACETLTTTNLVVNAGEITCAGWDTVDPEAIAREVVKGIGYDREELEFCDKTFEYINRLHGQSPDISQGVTEGEGLFAEQGAGEQDQGQRVESPRPGHGPLPALGRVEAQIGQQSEQIEDA